MKDWHQLEAGYLLNQLWIQISHFADGVIPIIHRSPFFSSIFLLPLGIFIVLLLLTRKVYIFIRFLKKDSILLELTPPAIAQKTAYTTTRLFSVIHDLGEQKGLHDWVLGRKKLFSFEIVSTRSEGIRYLIRTPVEEEKALKKHLLSYLPQIRIKTVDEYLPKKNTLRAKIVEYRLKKRFVLPLATQNTLEEHDPGAYITGMMTKLDPGELISFQIVLSPTRTREASVIANMSDEKVLSYITTPPFPWYMQILVFLFTTIGKLIYSALGFIMTSISDMRWGSDPKTVHAYQYYEQQHQMRLEQFERERPVRILNTFEQETVRSIRDKMNQPLFEGTIRLLVVLKEKKEQKERIKGFKSALANFSVPKYQALVKKYTLLPFLTQMIRMVTFRKRLLSLISNTSSSLFSVSEVADLYHFPFMRVTQTENIVKSLSRELPAPLSLKQETEFDVIIGKNTYAGRPTAIGLTEEKRWQHQFVIGGTGKGKTTLILYEFSQDVKNGKGVGLIDPHGDLAEMAIACVPDERKNDLVIINPYEIKRPVALNILELTPTLDEDELEIEKEFITEGIVSLFRKEFAKEGEAHAHRLEYVLRNTIYTAFTVNDYTIFTVYDLLNDPILLKNTIKTLTDERLKKFWRNEVGKAGDFQKVKMVFGVTTKIGRFLFSPMAKRILDNHTSTINFDDILNGKILICNLSKGNLSEDTSELLGKMILTKIQLAANKRARIAESKRKHFYLYVDEFQNFATKSFVEMLAEARKFKVHIIMVEQSTAQQDDENLMNVILANTGIVIVFRSASPKDEEMLLPQFYPYIEKGEILNLPAFHFYIKISALESEEPFSGETMLLQIKYDEKRVEKLKQISRDRYTIDYAAKRKQEQSQKEKENQAPQKKEETQKEEKEAIKDIKTSEKKYV